jgi:hypothetical protein
LVDRFDITAGAAESALRDFQHELKSQKLISEELISEELISQELISQQTISPQPISKPQARTL